MTVWAEFTRNEHVRILVLAAVLIAVSHLAETVCQGLRWRPYFSMGFPLAHTPLPLDRIPEGKPGAAMGLCWEADPNGATWWKDPDREGFGPGLHGIAWFEPDGRAVRLNFRWCPPWTPLLAIGVFAGVGATQGMGLIAGPGALLVTMIFITVYQRQAFRAAAALRFAWSRDTEQR